MTTEKVTLATIFSPANTERQFTEVPCPQWGGIVRAYGWTSDARDEFDAETVRRSKKKLKIRLRARLLIASICDIEGNPLFTADDEDKLAALPTITTDDAFKAAAFQCGYGGDE